MTSLPPLRDHLTTILRAAIDAVDAGRLVQRALADPDIRRRLEAARAIHVIAAGKAAAVMMTAFDDAGPHAGPALRGKGRPAVRTRVAIGPGRPEALPPDTEWFAAGHPLPTETSVAAARRALAVAASAAPDDLLFVLLSGGGSALMTLPADGITLAEKQQTARTLMAESADIYELNTVRKHLSAIKGGRLAAASAAPVLTLAVSDVVGDDLSVIASGPTVPDDSTYAAALDILARRGGFDIYPPSVVAHLRRGVAAQIDETPKRGDPRLVRSDARVIGPQRGAIDGAAAAAAALGYHVHVIREPMTGEARVAAPEYAARLQRDAASLPRPLCVIASGETTVTVRGSGKGGRNQEFAFAFARAFSDRDGPWVAASIGTDGIDGPTDAAGAIVDPTTFQRAQRAGINDANHYLDNNDTYVFFDRLGDLVRTGPTNTNVGDIQVVLIT